MCSGPLVRPPAWADDDLLALGEAEPVGVGVREHDLVGLQEAQALGALDGGPGDERAVGDDLQRVGVGRLGLRRRAAP